MKAKKGDIVYLAGRFNGFNTVLVSKLIIVSWGKKQARATHFKSGELLSENIYLNDGDCDLAFLTRKEASNHALTLLTEDQTAKEFKKHTEMAAWVDSPKSAAKGQDMLDDYAANGVYVVDYCTWIAELIESLKGE